MITNTARSKGFSLIELMIAMVLGLVIVGGSISIFTGVLRSSNLNQSISNLQSNARFALEMIGRDVRGAGFIGCPAERNVALNVSVSNPPTNNLAQTAISGHVVGAAAWQPAMPTAYTAATGVGAPVPGTHALSVQYADFPGYILNASMTSATSAVVVTNNSDQEPEQGQLMVLSDCSSADLFKVSSVAKAANRRSITPERVLSKGYSLLADYPDNARAMTFVSTVYYIGDTQRVSEAGDPVYSLYAHRYPYTAANPPLEMIEGVDQLVLQFGVEQSDQTLRYVTAGAAGYDPTGIETVRVGLLVSSLERFSEVDAGRTFDLAGQSVSPASPTTAAGTPAAAPAAGGLSYIPDNRLRMPFNATFNVRNRNL